MKRKTLISVLLIFAMTAVFVLHPTVKAEDTVVLSNPAYDAEKDYAKWDCIYFGYFPQFDLNVKEPVKWRVLSVHDNEALLLSDLCLFSSDYMLHYSWPSQWSVSAVKGGLISFANEAFNQEEMKAIIPESYTIKDINLDVAEEVNNEKIRILSWDEACNPAYGFCENPEVPSNTRKASVTNYAYNKSTVYNNWWLNSPGEGVKMMCVTENGYVSTQGIFIFNDQIGKFKYFVVRPVIKIDITKTDVWNYAGTVDSEGRKDETGVIVKPEARPISTPNPDRPVVPDDTPGAGGDSEVNQTIEPEPTAQAALSSHSNPQLTPPTKNTVVTPVSNNPAAMHVKAKIKSLKKKGKNVKIRVKKINGADGYQVFAATKEKGKYKIKLNIKAPKVSGMIKKLKNGKTYYIKIRAYTNTDAKKIYGKDSGIKKIKL